MGELYNRNIISKYSILNKLREFKKASSKREAATFEGKFISLTRPADWSVAYGNVLENKIIGYNFENRYMPIVLKPIGHGKIVMNIQEIENFDKLSFNEFKDKINKIFEGSIFYEKGIIKIGEEKKEKEKESYLKVQYKDNVENLVQHDTFLVTEKCICLVTYLCDKDNFLRYLIPSQQIINSIKFK